MLIRINRTWQDNNQTLGSCIVHDNNKPVFVALSLERGWRDNQTGVSCIPLGTYQVVLEYSDRFKTDLWEIKGVPGRSECKFHAANYWHQLNGCVALGDGLDDINNDGYNDVLNSKKTMKAFHEALNGTYEALLVITGSEDLK